MGWSLVLVSLMMGACTLSNGGKTFVDPLAAHIDTTVRAQDDFWTFANGTWLKENPIPASEKENGIFTAVADTVRVQVLEICKETSSKEYPKGSNEQKVGDLYFSGMDSVSLNANGINDLKDDLVYLDQLGNFDQFNAMVAYINTISNSPLFSFYVGQDDMNSNLITVSLGQGGTSMPSRGYYENQDENSKAVRNAFLVYAKGLFERMGMDEQAATKAADKQLERSVAGMFKRFLSKHDINALPEERIRMLEYAYASNMVNALVVYARGCGKEKMRQKYDFFFNDFKEQFPDYKTNPYFSPFKSKKVSLKIRTGVDVTMTLHKMGIAWPLFRLIAAM